MGMLFTLRTYFQNSKLREGDKNIQEGALSIGGTHGFQHFLTHCGFLTDYFFDFQVSQSHEEIDKKMSRVLNFTQFLLTFEEFQI